jgi:hypothetical protein
METGKVRYFKRPDIEVGIDINYSNTPLCE